MARSGLPGALPYIEEMDHHDAVESADSIGYGVYGDVGQRKVSHDAHDAPRGQGTGNYHPCHGHRSRDSRHYEQPAQNGVKMGGEGQGADYRPEHDVSVNRSYYHQTGHHGVQADDKGTANYRGRGHQNLQRQGSYGGGKRFGRGHSTNGGYRQQHGRNRSNSGNYNDGRNRSNEGANYYNDGRNRSDAGNFYDYNRKNQEVDYMDPDRVIPPNCRRTLIFSNVHPDIRHGQIKRHFESVWKFDVQHVSIFTDEQESYVKFKNVDDAMTIWRAGNEGLDGQYGVEDGQFSFVKQGIQLKDVYQSNCVPEESPRRRIAQGQTPYPNQQSNKAAKYYDNSNGPGGRPYHPDEYRDESARHQYQKSPTNMSNNTYHRDNTPMQISPQKKEVTPEELAARDQHQAEQQKLHEEFLQWRVRRKTEYDAFVAEQAERLTQIAKSEQKRDLLLKQESMLSKQLTLHKKMLGMLKSKNAPAGDQSKKMKEILSTQSRVNEIKLEVKGLVEDIEKLKEQEKTKGRFKPSEPRPVFSETYIQGNFKMDRRTTVLKVTGDKLGDSSQFTEEGIRSHFVTFGTLSNVVLEDSCALIEYDNRANAETARAGADKFDGIALRCEWHYEPLASIGKHAPSDEVKAEEEKKDSVDDNDDDNGAYEHLIEGAGYYGMQQGQESDACGDDQDEGMVDYD